MYLEQSSFRNIVAAIITAAAISGCSGSSGGGVPAISGTVSAPAGTVAFFQPRGMDRLFAAVFGAPAYGDITGVINVGGGVTVNLIEVDAAGNQVGATLATATTASDGSYSIEEPAGFTPGPQYIVRADGGGGASIDARVTSSSVNIDPVTNAASDIVTTGGNLSNLTAGEVDVIVDTVDSVAQDIDASGLGVDSLTTALSAEAASNEEAANVIYSTVTTGQICGTVTDGSNPLENIVIVVRDFGNWVTRAKIKTDATGNYCVNVPKAGDTNPDGGTFSGDYIVGAINATGASFAASEWYTSGGGANNQFSAEKVSVPNTTTVTIPFVLDTGGRIKGIALSTDGTTPLEGIKVMVRDFTSNEPVAITQTKADGTFRVNVANGTYTVGTRNSTIQAYAGGLYNGPATGSATPVTAGGSTASEATPITVSASSETVTKFKLAAGARVYGQVTDGSTAQAGMAVRFYDASGGVKNGAFVEAVRTNKVGYYRMWVQPGTYDILSRGQTNTAVVASAGTGLAAQDFTSSSINTITATLQDGSGNGVSQAKVRIYDVTGTAYTFQGFEVSNADGTVTAYTSLSNALIEFKLDNGQTTLGSAIYNTTALETQLGLGTSTATPAALGTVNLPSGGELKGTVTVGGSAVGNALVQIRNGGKTGAERFTTTRTQSDGSYSISLPAGTYTRVCAVAPGLAASTCPGSGSGSGSSAGNYAFQDSVAVSANGSTTQNLAIP